MKNNNLIYLAKIGKAVGLKGFLRLFIDSDFPEQFQDKSNTFYFEDNSKVEIDLYNSKTSQIKLKNINTPEEARKFTNKSIFSTIEDSRSNCNLGKDDYFWFELENLSVLEEDKCLGKVKEVVRYSDMNYLHILTNDDLVKQGFNSEFLIPYVKKDYILDVHLSNEKILVQKSLIILENS